jgi:hypothetical protein
MLKKELEFQAIVYDYQMLLVLMTIQIDSGQRCNGLKEVISTLFL